MELILIQSAIIFVCPFIFLTTAPKYQLSDVATMEKVKKFLEGELAQ